MSSTRRLRSAVPPEERELEIKRQKQELEKLNRPFIKYSGKMNYVTTLIDCACACDNLLDLANRCLDEEIMVVGFDMEWPFSFQTGPGKTALIQISPNLDVCHLLHVPQLKKLPKSLTEFLEHPKVRLTGVNIKNDIRKLCRDFGGLDVEKLLANCLDSGVMANTILPVTQRWSMEKLVDYVLKMKINKDKKVRMSKWHIMPLSKQQQIYAAIDGYASLLLYKNLKKIEIEMQKEQDKNILNECDL